MKAIKLYNIKWDTKDVSAEDMKKLNLPEYKGFIVNDDDYDVVEIVPNLLKKKFGYDIIDFSFNVSYIILYRLYYLSNCCINAIIK